MKTYLQHAVCLLAFCGLSACMALAQISPYMNQGLSPYKSYSSTPAATISLTTGNVSSILPLISFPQRGGVLQSGIDLEYNTPVYTVQGSCDPYTGQCFYYWTPPSTPTNWMGYSTVSPQKPLTFGRDCAQPGQPLIDGSTSACWGIVSDYTGATHTLGYLDANDEQAIDGSGWKFNWTNGIATNAQGIHFSSNSTEDPNGNIPDTLNRTVGTALNGGEGSNSTNTSGCTGPASQDGKAFSVYIYTVSGQNGGTAQYKLCWADYYIDINTSSGNVNPFTGYIGLLQSVVLPNGTAWTFKYNNWGALDEIDYPTGGAEFLNYGLSNAYSSINYPYVTSTNPVAKDYALDSNQVNPQAYNSFPSAGSGIAIWQYGGSNGTTVPVIDPNGNETDHTFTDMSGCGDDYETETDYYSGNGSGKVLLREVLRSYQKITNPYVYKYGQCPNDRFFALPTTITTIENNNEVKQETRTYDSPGFLYYGGFPNSPYGEVTEDDVTDYGAGAPGPVLRKTITTYEFQANSNYLTNNLLTLPESVLIDDGNNNEQAYTTYGYDENPLGNGNSNGVQHDASPSDGIYRGNLTSVHRWVNTGNYDLVTGYTYNDTGTLASQTDAGINTPGPDVTSYGYSGTYDGNYRTSTTNALGHTISGTYDFNTGDLLSYTGENGNTSNFTYDALNRLTSAIFPAVPVNCATPNNPGACGDAAPETYFTYSDDSSSTPPFHVERRQCMNDDASGCTDGTDLYVNFDGLGRESYRYSNNGQGEWTETAVCYTPDGPNGFTAYPFDTTSPTAPDCNSNGTGLSGQNWPGDATTYDALGRPLTITHADGSTIQTSYTGRATEVADEGNGTYDVTRISQVNGLGELTNVCEVDSQSLIGPGGAPAACGLDIGGTGFLTSYSYNPLGSLTEVQQNGLDNRVYGYDSLGRLTSSDNPETGTLSYTYDNAACGAPAAPGSLTCRTDANSITTAYFYDALRRLTQKTYSDGTPTLEIGYDQSGGGGQTLYNTLGRESTAVSGNTAEMFSYDADGRPQNHYECFSSTCGSNLFEIGYGHDLLGDMTAIEVGGIAPQGAPLTFEYSYNQAARLTGMSSNYVDASHPATLLSGASYNARGQVLSDTLGNGVPEQWTYDGNGLGVDAPGRGRLTQISAGANGAVYSESLSYAADGDVASVNDSVNGAWTYQYDPMNRLAQANCGSASGCDGVPNGNGLAFVYDRFGNLWQQNYVQGGQAGAQVSFTGGNNRMDGYSYNAAGDLLNDGVHGYTYNARNQLTGVDGGATASYTYFPSGQRATKTTGGNICWYLYDAQGHQIAELNPAGSWLRGELYAGGRHIGSYANASTYFDDNDSLNTARVRTGISGAISQTCSNWPFGNALSCNGTGGSPLHFTGQERDQESGLDYFGARYDSSNFGRFLTPDWSATPAATPYASLANPQSLNLYNYVLDNPVTNVDSFGHVTGDNCVGSSKQKGNYHGCTGQRSRKKKKIILKINNITVTYKFSDGSTIVIKGTHAWRDNNPGNLKGGFGAIGFDNGGGHRIAVYSSAAHGWHALRSTLSSNKYRNRTLGGAMRIYAPSNDGNNPLQYATYLANSVGVLISTNISKLTKSQFAIIEISIAREEGYFNEGNTEQYFSH